MKDAYQSCCLCGRDIEWLEETIGDNILAGIPIRHRACAERNAYLLSPPTLTGPKPFNSSRATRSLAWAAPRT